MPAIPQDVVTRLVESRLPAPPGGPPDLMALNQGLRFRAQMFAENRDLPE